MEKKTERTFTSEQHHVWRELIRAVAIYDQECMSILDFESDSESQKEKKPLDLRERDKAFSHGQVLAYALALDFMTGHPHYILIGGARRFIEKNPHWMTTGIPATYDLAA